MPGARFAAGLTVIVPVPRTVSIRIGMEVSMPVPSSSAPTNSEVGSGPLLVAWMTALGRSVPSV